MRQRAKPVIGLLLMFTILALFCKSAKGMEENEAITEQQVRNALESYGVYMYDKQINDAVGEISGLSGKSYSDVVHSVLTGSIDISEAAKEVLRIFLQEIIHNGESMRYIIVIALLGAVLKSLNVNFANSAVGEIGSYIIYISLVSVIIASFVSASQIASGSISGMSRFMQALIPLIMALLVASGRYAISFVFHPSVMVVTEIAAFIIDKIVLNLIMFIAIIQMVNYLMKAGALDNMADLACGIVSGGLKLLAAAFMALTSLKAASAPIATGLIGKSAKTLVSAVPVVGGAFAGAVDSVFLWGSAIKNAAAIGAIVCVIFICAIPLLKILVLVFIYKLTSALLQPFADDRAVSLINAAGSYIKLYAVAVLCVMVMFVTLLMMVIAGAMG